MNAKKKIVHSVITMLSMVFITIFASVLALSLPSIQDSARAKTFDAYGVAATISGNYYIGDKSYKMMSGKNDKIVFSSYDDESFPALDMVEPVKLSSKNDFIVFEYKFENNSNQNSFITRFSDAIETENMDIYYEYSYSRITNFEQINKHALKDIPVFKGNGNQLYLYIKAKISNLSRNSKLSGMFCFNVETVDVREIKLIDGIIGDKIYAALGFEFNDVKVPNLPGLKFEGYFTKIGGRGQMVFDENGKSTEVFDNEDMKILYAHYTQK